jgi:AcrR family transcriptional regulator
VLDAALHIVTKQGYPAATVEAIAARSGVAKTTIYRSWPNRAFLLLDLFLQLAVEQAPPPEGKDPIRALRRELREVAQASEALPGRLLIWLLGEGEHDAALREALMQRIFTPRRQATARVIERAQEGGAIRRDVPPLDVVDLLFGPLFYRKLVRRETVTVAFAEHVFRNVMAGLRPAHSRAE